ncbi:MAG: hypothetical protein IPM82_02260 [Saprospiraceae bacterium]|nr:hypothetical protein [Saprospiraceae bacterium]
MKKLIMCAMATLMLFAGITTPLMSVTTPHPIPLDSTRTAAVAEVNSLTLRLNEIKGMDKSNMSREEKKTLRKEVRSIKKEMKQLSGGVYISASALLIILILILVLA